MDAISMACGEVVGLFSFCLFFYDCTGSSLWCTGFSFWLLLLWSTDSRHVGLVVESPGLGIKPMSLGLVGGFLASGLPEKSEMKF